MGDIASFSYGKLPKHDLLGKGCYVTFSGYKYIERYPEYNCEKGDVILVARGVGGTGDVKLTTQRCFLTNLSIKLDLDNRIVLNDYFYNMFRQENLRYLDSGSAQSQITIQDLANVIIEVPSIDKQKRIAGVLSSLDDKIDLLHRENATLEALAETLFRHFFIENPDPTWKEGKVSDIAIHCKDSINPQNHSDEIFFHYSIPAYDNEKRPTEEQGRNIQSNKYVIPQKCILFSKLNPHKDKRVWLMLDDVQPNAICSTEFQIVKPQNDQWLYFLYGWLTYKENYDEIASGVSGTSGSHQRIDPKAIFDNECLIVDDGILAQYNEQVIPIFKKVESNQQQMQTMVAKRDTLLPRLMSGEVIVGE